MQSATGWLIERRGHAQPDALAGATPYLKLLGDVVGGWMLGKAGAGRLAPARRRRGSARTTARTKIGLARVFAEQVLGQAPGLTQAVTQRLGGPLPRPRPESRWGRERVPSELAPSMYSAEEPGTRRRCSTLSSLTTPSLTISE